MFTNGEVTFWYMKAVSITWRNWYAATYDVSLVGSGTTEIFHQNVLLHFINSLQWQEAKSVIIVDLYSDLPGT